jgi:dihydropyrimidine dehydrogenase (NADP+)
LISEKSAKYWIEGCKETKKEFPNHEVVASFMCANNKEDW